MRKSPEEVLAELTGSPAPSVGEAQEAAQVARSHNHESRPRTRSFRGSIDGREVLVTIHDPEGYGEVAFCDPDGRWGPPSELHEEA